jgi:signal transduction histidine kinase/CheY-like chemotaxis protein
MSNTTWIYLNIGCFLSYIIINCTVTYAPNFQRVCNYEIEGKDMYKLSNYMCLAGFAVLFVNKLIKLTFVKFHIKFIPIIIALSILFMTTMTAYLQTKYETTYCIDSLGVATSKFIWAEWISCSPLIIYSTVIIVTDSNNLDYSDFLTITSYTLCIFFGFMLLISSPVEVGQFLLTLSFLSFTYSLYEIYRKLKGISIQILPLRDISETAEMNERITYQKLRIQRMLYTLFFIVTTCIPIVYLIALFDVIGYESTIIAFNVMSLIVKGLYVDSYSASYIILMTKLDDYLVEETNSNKARREFVKYIFHEVRTPFNSISLALDLLHNSCKERKSESEYINIMQTACEQINETLNSILTMQKIEEGKLELEYTDCDIHMLFNKLFHIMKSTIELKQIRYKVMFSSNTPKKVFIDAGKIEHVIMNLISNSLKFTPKQGSITVNVSFEYGTVQEHLNKDPVRHLGRRLSGITKNQAEDFLMSVSVTDNGPGISEENIRKLFKNFSQIDAGKLQNGKGSGLGLLFCKQIVEMHKGNISVHSIVGKGSTFKFVIPIPKFDEMYMSNPPSLEVSNRNPNQASNKVKCIPSNDMRDNSSRKLSPIPQEEDLSDKSERVLIVDDSAMNRKLLKQLFSLHNAQANEAENGKLALEEIQKDVGRYKLVVIDNYMPVMDGIIATKQMRMSNYRNMIVGLTGNILQEDKDIFMKAGLNYVFTKPISRATVNHLIEFIKIMPENIDEQRLIELPDRIQLEPPNEEVRIAQDSGQE